jgi:serine phosphatase RsbU (regulator of sigma subunit)
MIDVVMYGFARPAGGRRRIAGPLCIALGALALASPPAAAQLPDLGDAVKLPVQDGAVRDLVPGDVVEDTVAGVVDEPLPEPVEQVVRESPVAPVREEVRRVVKETTETGGGGGGSGATGNGSSTGGTGSGTGTPGGDSEGSTPRRAPGDGGGRRVNRRERARRARRAGDGADRAAAATPAAGRTRDASRAGARPDAERGARDDGRSAAVRTIETIVKAVPTPIWIALGVLALLALALGARTFVERRRARALARDREQLMHDVEVLERALLPAVPERLGALATSVAYRPSEGPAAGGDFYDAFELSDGRVAVLVGDVSGHGPDALEGTNSVRSQLHALLEAGLSPRAAIATVGERVPAQLAGRFTTVVVALHDPAEGTLTYATAGHPPPIIVGPGSEELLSAGASPPIGVDLRTGLRETTVGLPAGSLVCLYTDGLVEARAGDAMLGRGRLTAMVESLDPDELAGALIERVVAAADEASDDMAVCLLRPVSGADAPSPRVEILEVDPDDLASGFAERFLEACGVPAAELAGTIEQARAGVESRGRALVEVTVNGQAGQARVSAADLAAPPTPV